MWQSAVFPYPYPYPYTVRKAAQLSNKSWSFRSALLIHTVSTNLSHSTYFSRIFFCHGVPTYSVTPSLSHLFYLLSHRALRRIYKLFTVAMLNRLTELSCYTPTMQNHSFIRNLALSIIINSHVYACLIVITSSMRISTVNILLYPWACFRFGEITIS